ERIVVRPPGEIVGKNACELSVWPVRAEVTGVEWIKQLAHRHLIQVARKIQMRPFCVDVAHIEQMAPRYFPLHAKQKLLIVLKGKLRRIVGNLLEVELIRGQRSHGRKHNGPRRRSSLQLESGRVGCRVRENGAVRG